MSTRANSQPPNQKPANVNHLTDRLVVRVPPGSANAGKAVARLANVIIKHYPKVNEYVVQVPAGSSLVEFARELLATGDYEYVEPDWLVHAVVLPNDPLYPSQWHLPKIDAPIAWDIDTGNPSVIIAICDSGVDQDHPDLAAALVNGYNAVDQLPQDEGGQVDGLTDHGTQVAGTAAAIGNNAVGISGVGWDFSIMPIRVSNMANDTAFISDINDGARWAVENGAQIINVSFSNVQANSVQTTGEYIRSLGGVYVWAAGNAASSLGFVDHPDVIIVSATNQVDQLAGFSNFGLAIDVAAPGVDIFTTNLGSYGPISGTSFSSPMTCGVLGLIYSIHPGVSPQAAEIILKLTADDLGETGEDNLFGAGRINAHQAAQLALDAITIPLPPVAFDDEAYNIDGSAITIDVLQNDADLNGDDFFISAFDAQTAQGGTVEFNAKEDALVYTPAAGFEGFDQFTYTIQDETLLEDVGEVVVVTAIVPEFIEIESAVADGFGISEQIKAIDIDMDGDLDLVNIFISTLETVTFYENLGDGSFVDAGGVVVNEFAFVDINFADITGDGCLDIVFAERLANRYGILPGNCDFTFGETIETSLSQPTVIAANDQSGQILDFNSDGHADIALANSGSPANLRILLGDSTGLFIEADQFQLTDPPAAIKAADFTGDGRIEIAVGGAGFGLVNVFSVNESAQITHISTTQTGGPIQKMVVLDINGDSNIDIATVSAGSIGEIPGTRILINDSNANFTLESLINATGEFPNDLVLADLDVDGDIDLVMSHLLSNEITIFPGLPGGLILPFSASHDTQDGALGVAHGDFDGDQDIDLAVSVINFGPDRIIRIFENQTDPPSIPGDLDGDGIVNTNDLLILLSNWGPCGDCKLPGNCPADLDEDCTVGTSDLLILLSNWG